MARALICLANSDREQRHSACSQQGAIKTSQRFAALAAAILATRNVASAQLDVGTPVFDYALTTGGGAIVTGN